MQRFKPRTIFPQCTRFSRQLSNTPGSCMWLRIQQKTLKNSDSCKSYSEKTWHFKNYKLGRPVIEKTKKTTKTHQNKTTKQTTNQKIKQVSEKAYYGLVCKVSQDIFCPTLPSHHQFTKRWVSPTGFTKKTPKSTTQAWQRILPQGANSFLWAGADKSIKGPKNVLCYECFWCMIPGWSRGKV